MVCGGLGCFHGPLHTVPYITLPAYQTKVQKGERQAYWKHVENSTDIGDPESDYQPNKQNRFWYCIKALRKDRSGVAQLKKTTRCMTK